MKPEIKQKWIEALLSGEYKQANGVLRKDTNFCCLGVLCDLYRKDTGKGQWELGDNSSFYFVCDIFRDDSVLPLKVQDWAGMNSNNGLYNLKKDKNDFAENALSSDNDNGRDFIYIAERIKEHF